MEFNAVPQQRRVEVETAFGTVEGFIRSSSSVRTLDDLNLGADYLVVHESTGTEPDASATRPPLAIRKESILFVRETGGSTHAFSRGNPEKCWVSVVEYRVGPFLLRGTVHFPPGGDPIARLNQRNHQFLALTQASVAGSGRVFDVPFLAVNRQQIMSARELDGVAETVALGESSRGAATPGTGHSVP